MTAIAGGLAFLLVGCPWSAPLWPVGATATDAGQVAIVWPCDAAVSRVSLNQVGARGALWTIVAQPPAKLPPGEVAVGSEPKGFTTQTKLARLPADGAKLRVVLDFHFETNGAPNSSSSSLDFTVNDLSPDDVLSAAGTKPTQEFFDEEGPRCGS